MNDLSIRTAAPSDAAAISALVQHTVRISNSRDYPPQAVELIVANFAPDKVGQRMAERDVFICQKGDRIVGTIALGADRLRSLFVEPGLQQTGVGARLVAHLEAHARQVGAEVVPLAHRARLLRAAGLSHGPARGARRRIDLPHDQVAHRAQSVRLIPAGRIVL